LRRVVGWVQRGSVTGSGIRAGRDVRGVGERSGVVSDPARCKVCYRGRSSLCTGECIVRFRMCKLLATASRAVQICRPSCTFFCPPSMPLHDNRSDFPPCTNAGFQAVGSVQALASVGMPRNAASLVTFAALIVWSSCAGLVVGGSSHGLHLPAIREECAGTHVLRLQGGEGCIGAAGRNCGNIRAELQGLISSVPLPSVSGWIPGQARELVAAHLQVAGEKLHKVGVRVGKILEKCYVESHYLRHRLGRRLASYVRGIRERLENYVDSANCVFAAPPPRTHIKTQFQRLLLRIPCFSGSALARAESVGCMRGGGDATKVTAQLQGFLEAITSTADSVIKGVPGVIDGIKQLPKLRQLGAFKPGGAWHGQKRYVDLPSVVQVAVSLPKTQILLIRHAHTHSYLHT
jgi:hypothetical protein